MFDQAKWIWAPDAKEVNDYARFREEFTAPGGRATVRISVEGEYSLKIGGAYVGCGQFDDYREYKVYDEYQVDLPEGPCALECVAFCPVTSFFAYRGNAPALIFEVVQGDAVLLSSGGNTLAASDTGYASGPMEKISGQLSYAFAFDACHIPGPWKRASLTAGAEKLYPRPVRKLSILPCAPGEVCACGSYWEKDKAGTPAQRMQRAYLSYRPCKREQLPAAEGCEFTGEGGIYVLIDLFREEAGLFTMDIEVDTPCEVLIGWGEHTEDLRLRTSIGGRNFGARYMAHAGRQTFTHDLQRLGLRYVQLFFAAEKAKVYYAGLLPTPYPLGKMRIATSDCLHDEIARVSARTLELCMHEHYEDCPWREQALYAMDSRNQMLCGYYAFGEYDMPRASLKLLGLSLREDGMLELCAPARIAITIPSFTAMYVVELQEYVLFSGDLEFGREMLPTARKICDGFLAHTNQNGLMEAYTDKKYWNFYEWQPYLEGYIKMECDQGAREDAPLCAFVSIALSALARIMEMVGEPGAEAYRDAAERLASQAHRAFWDEEADCYASFRGQTGRFHYAVLTQALMLLCGAVPEEKQARLRARLSDGEGLVPATTAYTVFKFDALMAEPAVYARRVMDEVTRDWGKMLYSGATSFWETMNGARDFDDAGSLCHGWSAVPLYLYYRYALGLYPTAPGFASYKVTPVDMGLRAPQAEVTLRDGRVIRLGRMGEGERP